MIWELIVAFGLAATPWIELLVVIPLGLAWGLPPVPLAIVVFAGNTASVLPIVWLHGWWRAWRAKRRAAKGEPLDEQPHSKRGEWARRLWNRYGLPGLALLAPLVTGVHLATAIALLSGAPRRAVIFWMLASMVLWTVGVTVVTYYGIEGVRWLWG